MAIYLYSSRYPYGYFLSIVEFFQTSTSQALCFYVHFSAFSWSQRKYTHVSHQYSLDFADAEVIPSEDDGLIERFKFDFKPIDQVSSIGNGSFVDIIGICQKVSEVANFTSKKGTDLTKRTFWIVDHSASNIILSFWYLITSARDCCNSLSFTFIISSFTVSNSSCSLSIRFTKLSVRAFNAMFSLVSSWALFSLNNSSSIWVSCKTSFFCGVGWKSEIESEKVIKNELLSSSKIETKPEVLPRRAQHHW